MIKRKKNLSEELVKMKTLAGIITESNARLKVGKGMLLNVDDSTKSALELYLIPEEPHGEQMTRLSKDKLHVTLTSIAGFRGVQDVRAFETLDIEIPQVILGDARFVYRGDNKDDRRYLLGGKTTYVVAVENQDELRDYVDALYDSVGMDNPEPNRFFHITIANNAGGNPFESIGNVDKVDFE